MCSSIADLIPDEVGECRRIASRIFRKPSFEGPRHGGSKVSDATKNSSANLS